ncbi:MAG TPA: hypothetical protein VGD98_26040 [Ktedonobacteraceae bacterium]
MPRLYKFSQHALGRTILLCVIVGASLVYVAVAHQYLYTTLFGATPGVVEHQMDSSTSSEIQYWNPATMSAATDADLLDTPSNTSYDQQQSVSAGTPGQQAGHGSLDGNISDYRATVGKIFFSDGAGQNYVCSGTAIVSSNLNTIDTAGHCLYWNGRWMQNVIFCPLYDHGVGAFGCWAARDLFIPKDWQDAANLNDLHHDMGIAVLAPNDAGNLTDVVGAAGWSYNQKTEQPFYAYGYPAGSPYDGQSQQSCADGSKGAVWKHGAGQVISIPCKMTGGSSGGGWFIQSGGQYFLNGHNDFTSTMKPGHMFSPYYDDTWYAMYQASQKA